MSTDIALTIVTVWFAVVFFGALLWVGAAEWVAYRTRRRRCAQTARVLVLQPGRSRTRRHRERAR